MKFYLKSKKNKLYLADFSVDNKVFDLELFLL